jgi:hypothetical protein
MRLNRLTSRRILDSLGFKSISDIHLLFNNLKVEEMDDYLSTIDFTKINNYPRNLLEKAIEKLSPFHGNNVVSAKSHIKAFSSCINKWCSGAAHNHHDVKLKLFALSLDEDAFDWFFGLDDNKFKTISELIEAFTERWRDKKENCHLLVALHTIKKNENETMDNSTRNSII